MAHCLGRGTSGETLQAVSLSWLLLGCGAVLGRRGWARGEGISGDVSSRKWRVSGTAVYRGLSPQAQGPVISWSARVYQAVSWFHICVLLSCRSFRRWKLKVGEEMMMPLVNRKRFVSWLLQTLGSATPGEPRPCCCPHLDPQPLLLWYIPSTFGCVCTLGAHFGNNPKRLSPLLQEGVSAIMFCNTQEAENSISSDFFFKLHIISTPLPWTFGIEIEAQLDLVFWSKTRDKWKCFLCCSVALQTCKWGCHIQWDQMGMGRQVRSWVERGRNWAGTQMQNDPEIRRHQKGLFSLWSHIKSWAMPSVFIQEP